MSAVRLRWGGAVFGNVSVGNEFHEIAWLAVEGSAQGVERCEADGFALAGFDSRKIDVAYPYFIGKIFQQHFSIGHYLVESHDYRHDCLSLSVRCGFACKGRACFA